jgi:hypothetical protein
MASKTAILSVRVVTDAKQGTEGMEKAARGVERFQAGLDRLTVPAAAAGAAVVALGKRALDSASALEQSTGGVEAVFKAHADQVKALAADAAVNVGLATSEYQQFATIIGSQLKNAGVPMEQLAGQTNDLITLGADLAARYGGEVKDGVEALSAALKGEYDILDNYGISVNAAGVEAEKAAMGLDGLTGAADANATAQATLALIMRQTTDAQGAFASESDTAAGSMAIARAQWENASATLGNVLLPVVTAAATHFADMATWAQENASTVQVLVGVVGAFAAAVLVLQGIMIAVRVATAAWTAAQWLLNVAMNANPIGLIVLAIAAVVAVIALAVAGIRKLWRENETFRAVVLAAWLVIRASGKAAWDFIKRVIDTTIKVATAIVRAYVTNALAAWRSVQNGAGAAWTWITTKVQKAIAVVVAVVRAHRLLVVALFQAVRDRAAAAWKALSDRAKRALDAILAPVRAVRDAFFAVVGAVNSVISAIRSIRFPSPPGWLRNLGGFSAFSLAGDEAATQRLATFAADSETVAQQLITPAVFAPASSGAGAAQPATIVNVTVNGALDPNAVGRQIEDVVGKYLRRGGRRTLGQVVFA